MGPEIARVRLRTRGRSPQIECEDRRLRAEGFLPTNGVNGTIADPIALCGEEALNPKEKREVAIVAALMLALPRMGFSEFYG